LGGGAERAGRPDHDVARPDRRLAAQRHDRLLLRLRLQGNQCRWPLLLLLL
jgi:hypothetical protein